MLCAYVQQACASIPTNLNSHRKGLFVEGAGLLEEKKIKMVYLQSLIKLHCMEQHELQRHGVEAVMSNDCNSLQNCALAASAYPRQE